MPKLIKDMSKRRINQLISKEIKNAHVCQKTDNQMKDNSVPQIISLSDNASSSSVTSSNPLNTSKKKDNYFAEERECASEYIEVSFVNNCRVTAANTNEAHIPEYIKFYQEDESTPTRSLKQDLRFWLSENSVSQKAANHLIAIFRSYGHEKELKKDVRTLMKTPRNATGKIICGNGGSYFHFGIVGPLVRSIKTYYETIPKTISIQLNCDGMTFSNSSTSQFWPLLGSIEAEFYTEPFLIGLFHGYSKPNDFNIYINPFVDDMKNLQTNGIMIENKQFDIRLSAIICDAPARAYLTKTKSHSGYFGCSKCIQEGTWDSYVTFPEIDNPLRTDDSFKNMLQEEHHTGESLLNELDFGMVSQIPIDYQHLVCLGVMKRLLQRWCNGPRNERLSDDKLKDIDEVLTSMKACIPQEFARQPRLLDCVAKWKATECRQFLLYTGPIILKNIFRPRYYKHFMALSVAIRILCDPHKCSIYNNYANELLRWFVNEYKNLYGAKAISYNVHNLIHLANDVKKFGPLDNFSTFKFENYMSHIKEKIKNAPKPLEQVINRMHEESSLPIVKYVIKSYPIIENLDDKKITTLQFDGFTLSMKKKENCCLLSDNNILIIKHIEVIDKEIKIKGECFSEFGSLFLEPCDSKQLNIYSIKNNCVPKFISITSDFVRSKCLYFSTETSNESFVIPLLQYNN